MAVDMQSYNKYLDELTTKLSSMTPTVSYQGKSEDELKGLLTKTLRPEIDQAIQNRNKQTQTNKAAIDADAAARGMGSSTWVTDVKNRQQNAAATDVASMESAYGATLAQQLLGLLQNQDAQKLQTDQFNASQKTSALQQALSLAGSFYAEEQAGKGGGGSGSGSDQAWLDYLKELAEAKRKAERASVIDTGAGVNSAHGAYTSNGTEVQPKLPKSAPTLRKYSPQVIKK